jgi:DNA-binding CsgD family transcriptional regulator
MIRLSPSETKVIGAVADHGTITAAAAAVFLSPETVKTHLKHIRFKLGARNTTNAVAIAIRRGLI